LDKSARRWKVVGARTKEGKNKFIVVGVVKEERGHEHLGEVQERARAQKFMRKVKNCVDI
jgi:hypothetical protein